VYIRKGKKKRIKETKEEEGKVCEEVRYDLYMEVEKKETAIEKW